MRNQPFEFFNTIYNSTNTHEILYLGINLTKHVQGLPADNRRTLKKDVKEYVNKQLMFIACSWMGKITIVNMLVLPKLIYRFTQSHLKSQEDFFIAELDNLILKFIFTYFVLYIQIEQNIVKIF